MNRVVSLTTKKRTSQSRKKKNIKGFRKKHREKTQTGEKKKDRKQGWGDLRGTENQRGSDSLIAGDNKKKPGKYSWDQDAKQGKKGQPLEEEKNSLPARGGG